jgi:amino acid transporter
VNPSRFLITVIGAAIGACFTMVAILSIHASVAPVRRFHISSVIVAIISVCLAILAFRVAAMETDEEALVSSLRRGMFGAFLALIVICIFLFMLGDETRSVLAHSLSMPTSSFPTSLVLVGSVLLGFGAGFVLHMARSSSQKKS